MSDSISNDVLNEFKVFTFSVDINNEEEFESVFDKVFNIRCYFDENNIKYEYKEDFPSDNRMVYTIVKK
jgi:hypothetical protein